MAQGMHEARPVAQRLYLMPNSPRFSLRETGSNLPRNDLQDDLPFDYLRTYAATSNLNELTEILSSDADGCPKYLVMIIRNATCPTGVVVSLVSRSD